MIFQRKDLNKVKTKRFFYSCTGMILEFFLRTTEHRNKNGGFYHYVFVAFLSHTHTQKN